MGYANVMEIDRGADQSGFQLPIILFCYGRESWLALDVDQEVC